MRPRLPVPRTRSAIACDALTRMFRIAWLTSPAWQVTGGSDPVRQHKPVTYQVIDGTRRDIDSRYVIDANAQIGFEVGAYDAAQALVIDPVLTYSTYFGSLSEELITDIALDAAGNIYLTGLTSEVPQFPLENAAFPIKPGLVDGFVTKFNPAGTAIIYSTFLGGAQNDNGTEHYARIAEDAAGVAYIAGNTLSANFPTTANADDAVFNGDAPSGNGDAYLTELTPGGALLYSTSSAAARTTTQPASASMRRATPT